MSIYNIQRFVYYVPWKLQTNVPLQHTARYSLLEIRNTRTKITRKILPSHNKVIRHTYHKGQGLHKLTTYVLHYVARYKHLTFQKLYLTFKGWNSLERIINAK